MNAHAVVLAVDIGTAREVVCGRCKVWSRLESDVWALTADGLVRLGELTVCPRCEPDPAVLRLRCHHCGLLLARDAAAIVEHLRLTHGIR